MKLILLAALLIVASATEHPRGKLVQLCGAELARAMKQVCEDGDLDFFNLQHVQKEHHDHTHNPDHNLDHNHEGQEMKGHVVKRDVTFSYSVADECCAKPCYVADFLTYCP